MILHPYRRIAAMLCLAALLAVTFFVGIAVGITLATSRSVQLTPAQSGAPLDPGVAQPGERRLKSEVGSSNPPAGANGGAPTPTAAAQPSVQTVSVSGTASWYADGAGLYAAVPSWSWGDTPYTAQVCGYEGGRTNCLLLTVRDFCQCYVGTNRERVIDLSPEAFRSLAPLSAGHVTVTVEWLP